MGEKWTAAVWGTRGAIPMAGADCLEYGGNTSCVSVRCGGTLVVFDAGSGIVRLGAALAQTGETKEVHLFLSHLHLDHILGMVGFSCLSDPKGRLHLYGEARGGVGFREQLDRLLGPPYWPLTFQRRWFSTRSGRDGGLSWRKDCMWIPFGAATQIRACCTAWRGRNRAWSTAWTVSWREIWLNGWRNSPGAARC